MVSLMNSQYSSPCGGVVPRLILSIVFYSGVSSVIAHADGMTESQQKAAKAEDRRASLKIDPGKKSMAKVPANLESRNRELIEAEEKLIEEINKISQEGSPGGVEGSAVPEKVKSSVVVSTKVKESSIPKTSKTMEATGLDGELNRKMYLTRSDKGDLVASELSIDLRGKDGTEKETGTKNQEPLIDAVSVSVPEGMEPIVFESLDPEFPADVRAQLKLLSQEIEEIRSSQEKLEDLMTGIHRELDDRPVGNRQRVPSGKSEKRDSGTIAIDNVSARTGPNVEESRIMLLSKGMELQIEQKAGCWYQVVIPTGARAWIPASAVEGGGCG